MSAGIMGGGNYSAMMGSNRMMGAGGMGGMAGARPTRPTRKTRS